MIREEFLAQAAKNNLALMRDVRDTAVILAAGYTAEGYRSFSAYERIRICAELKLRDAAEAGAGLVGSDRALLSEYTAAAENKTAALTGIPLPRDLTVLEKKLLSKTTPPVGKLPQVYDRIREISAAAVSLTTSLGDLIGALYDNVASGKLLHAMPLSGMEALGKLVDDYNMTAREMCKDVAHPAACDRHALKKLIGVLAASLDPYYENEWKNALLGAEGREGDVLAAVTDAVLRGAKTTALPLTFDLCCRYASLR